MFNTNVLCSGFSRVATEDTMLGKTELLGPVDISPHGIVDSWAL